MYFIEKSIDLLYCILTGKFKQVYSYNVDNTVELFNLIVNLLYAYVIQQNFKINKPLLYCIT